MMLVWRIWSLHLVTARLVVDFVQLGRHVASECERTYSSSSSYSYLDPYRISYVLHLLTKHATQKAFLNGSIGELVSVVQFMSLVSKSLFVDKKC